jgi:hypothetical protein
MSARMFDRPGDDRAYRDWLVTNPESYVVNCRTKPTERYLVLHRATSRCLDFPNPTLRYAKICGTLPEIERFVGALSLDPKRIHLCSNCMDH